MNYAIVSPVFYHPLQKAVICSYFIGEKICLVLN